MLQVEFEALFAHATVMVLPSTLEGLSITLLEGMAAGRACLVSDIAPNLEVAAGVAAVFHSGDADALARELAALLEAPSRRAELGNQARERVVRDYSWDVVAERTAALYRSLLGGTERVATAG